MTGWITDVARLLWGALFWNTRKTWHAARGRRGPCPCQAASDSGRGGETGCDAAHDYRSPHRFRAVCPLLARRADGAWVCSVNAADVRPFWGRAFLLLLGGGSAAYVLLALLAYCALRGAGYDVSPSHTFWPGKWSEFRAVQSRFYLEKAREARAASRPAEALLALSNAYELNPRDYAAGYLLAQLYQAGQPMLSDGVFVRLYRDHPDRRAQTAEAWYRAMLARGDFESVLTLAGNRLAHSGDAAPSPAWTQAYLFAAERLGRRDALARLLENASLPDHARRLFLLEQTLPALAPEARVEALVRALDGERDPFAIHHLLRRLLAENRLQLVWARLAAPDCPLGDREKTLLRLDVLARAGRLADREKLFRQLLTLPSSPALCELLTTHLVAHPDVALARAMAEKLARDPLPPSAETTYPQLLAWFAACAVSGDAALAQSAASLVAASAARDSRALEFARKTLLGASPGFRIETVLPLLQPLPLETTYALYERYPAAR